MSVAYDINVLRNIVLESQHLRVKSTDSIESIVSDICGLQYDPNPTVHLNQYMMLWCRKKDFSAEQLDIAAYQEFTVIETWAFRRNMFFVPRSEYSLYREATKGIVRWGESDEGWLAAGDSPEVRAAEDELKERLAAFGGLTAKEIWDALGLAYEWNKYRREHDQSYNLPVFRAFYRLVRIGDLLTCGRRPGTFREPVYILKEKLGLPDPSGDPVGEKQAVRRIVEKLTASFGVTDPVHISHISGFRTADIAPIFEELTAEGTLSRLPYKIGRKQFYVHTVKAAAAGIAEDSREIRLISPMDVIVRDKAWLEALFDYSFTFEYFKKKGMKWPLSILAGNRFVGYLDCRMDRKTGKFIVKERNIFDPAFSDKQGIDAAIRDLAAFHGAKEIVEKG